MNAPLELHLKLDGSKVENQWHDGHGVATTSWNTLEDSSGNGRTCAFFGNADIVADDAFGACANFDGDTGSYIKAPADQALKITGDVTIEAWVYITKAVKDWVRVIGKGTVGSRSYGLWYIMTGTETTWLFQRGVSKSFHDCKAVLKSPAPTLNTWYHLAGVVEGKKSVLYVHDLKGKLILREDLDNTPSGAAIDNDSAVTIGYGMMNFAHTGKIAHARIYKGALSQAEIERDITSDRLALVPFRKSHPIDFRLYDENGQPALYIVDDSADAKITTVKLELTNSSTQSIQIPPAPPATGADDHHFALCFRPGTLSDSTKKKLQELTRANQATIVRETDEWELAHAGKDPGPVNLFLSYKGPKKSFGPQEKLTLTLHGISADAGTGSRGTQVELIPRHLTYVNDDTPITGSRMRYLHITNHRGQKNIPLHVWFVEGNAVLNDGKSQTKLTLCIGNGSGDRDILLNKASRLVISFDVFDVGDAVKADWALTDKNSADKVEVKHGEDKLTKPGGGQDPNDTFREWELFPNQQVLAKRGSKNSKPIEITLDKITTSLSTGHANLYVRYENIPGYQDGQFILTVEKTPLRYDAKGNIAIGKSIREKDPPKVDVNGTVVAERLSVARETKQRGGLFFAVAGDFNHAVYNNHSNLDGEGAWDGAKWNTHEGLNLRVGDQYAKPSTLRSALLINATGNVGIGAGLDIKKDVVSSLTINKKIANGAYYDYSAAPLSIFLPLGKHNGGSATVGTEDILHLVREGVADQAFGNKVSLAIGRYENNGLNSRTQLDIKLTDGHFADHNAVLSLRSNGNVGIGTQNPGTKLEIMDGSLQVTASHESKTLSDRDPAYIGTFYAKDKIQGIGISSNGITAIGAVAPQNLYLTPGGFKGAVMVDGCLQVRGPLIVKESIHHPGAVLTVEGPVEVKGSMQLIGSLTVAGGVPIFNPGRIYDDASLGEFVKTLIEDYHYKPGCFMIFPGEGDKDPVLLWKTSYTEAAQARLWRESTVKYSKQSDGTIRRL